ncbi:MAG: hypothetical protein ACTHMI_22485 [Mucilaginibacter sp.]
METGKKSKRSVTPRVIKLIRMAVLCSAMLVSLKCSPPARNAAQQETDEKTNRYDTATTGSAIATDTAAKADTTAARPAETKVIKKIAAKTGTLGYHYSPAMAIHETQEINVYLSPNNSKSAIRDTIHKILVDEDPNRNPNDTGKIEFKEQIPLYRHVTMQLLPLDSGILIRKLPDMNRQEVDTVRGNTWSWSVYANSAEKEQSTLALVITSENPDHIEKRFIHIKIHVEDNVFRIFYNYLIGHPGDFILKILAPAIAAIWGVIFWKRRSGAKKDGDTPKDGE